MSDNHDVVDKNKGIHLPSNEAHLAALCVAVVMGSIGGNVSILLINIIPFWSLFAVVIALGFIIPWFVCKYLFKTAHAWYGSNTLSHRLYDGVGIISAVIAFYI